MAGGSGPAASPLAVSAQPPKPAGTGIVPAKASASKSPAPAPPAASQAEAPPGRLAGLWGSVNKMLRGDPEMQPFLRPYRKQMWAARALLVGYSLLGTSLAWGMGRLIDLAVEGAGLPDGLALLIMASTLLLFVNVLYAGVEWLQGWLEGRLGALMLRDFRKHLFAHLTTLPLATLRKHRPQQIASRLSDDVASLSEKNINIPLDLPFAFLEIAFNAAMLFTVHWGLGLGIIALLPFFAWLSSVFGKKLERLSEEAADKRAEMVDQGADTLSNIEILRTFGSETGVREIFDESVESFSEVKLKENLASSWYQALASSLGDLATKILVISLGAWSLFLWGAPSVGTITSMQIYAYVVAASIERISDTWTQYREADGATKRVLSLLAERSALVDAPDAVELGPLRGEIRVEDLYFSYDGRHNTLKAVSFSVQPGQTVALVGGTGSGKTTLLRLLARLYDPKKGRILIDGVDLRQARRESLTRQLALVPQDSGLLNGTIRRNLLLVKPEATKEELQAALEAAHAGFVFDPAILPDGLETEVGDKGTRLSGGQKQRIAIARALLRNPRLLLLDEATSNLDNESERLVQEALQGLMRDRTTFVVAHRLTTIRDADLILVLDKGRIVESGTHEDLLTRGGKYFELWNAAERGKSAGERKSAVSG